MPKGSGAPPAKVKVRVSLFGTLFCLLGFYYVTHALLGPAFSRALARLDWGVLLFSPVLLAVAWNVFAKRRRAVLSAFEGRPLADCLGATLIARMLDECSLARRGGIFASYLVAKQEKIPFLRVIALYGVELLVDVAVLGAYGAVVLTLGGDETSEGLLWRGAFALAASCAGLALWRVLRKQSGLPLLAALLLRLLAPGFAEPLTQTLAQAPDLGTRLRRVGLWFTPAFYSLLYWAAYSAFFGVLATALRLDLDPTLWPVLAGALLLGDFLPALPSRTGLSEALLFAVLKTQDIPNAEALLFALCAHVLILLASATTGIVNLIWQRGGAQSTSHEPLP